MKENQVLQQQELLALQNIYLEDIKVTKESNPVTYEIICKPYVQQSEIIQQHQYNLRIQVELTKNYPQTPAKLDFFPITDICQDHIAEIEQLSDAQLAIYQGQPIIFQIVEAIREWIDINIIQVKLNEANNEGQVDEDYVERMKFDTYTEVNDQNFIEWKDEYIKRIREIEAKEKNPDIEKRLTGKQFFRLKWQNEGKDFNDVVAQEKERVQKQKDLQDLRRRDSDSDE